MKIFKVDTNQIAGWGGLGLTEVFYLKEEGANKCSTCWPGFFGLDPVINEVEIKKIGDKYFYRDKEIKIEDK
ncbi:MAG: hypothetical protein WCX88_01340 [Patescibacteria group bacterium]